LRFEVIGTALNLYFGPAAGPLTLVASATDTTFAAGLNGIRLAGNGAVADYLLEAI
jgi:hypothetical protein